MPRRWPDAGTIPAHGGVEERPRRASTSADWGEAGGGEQVGLLVVAGVDDEVEDGLADLLWAEGRAETVKEGGGVHALLACVGGDGGRAEVGPGGQPGEHGGESDGERLAVGLRLGIGGKEPDGGLGAGVAAAER